MSLKLWQDKLAAHFQTLKSLRGELPIFALEHSLSPSELDSLKADIRAAVSSNDYRSHFLPWLVYSSEIGYQYSGDEYWSTFESLTPSWRENGDRWWLRRCFEESASELHLAAPAGTWASHFSIICWPITNAIIPRDLQRQLVSLLFQERYELPFAIIPYQPKRERNVAIQDVSPRPTSCRADCSRSS